MMGATGQDEGDLVTVTATMMDPFAAADARKRRTLHHASTLHPSTPIHWTRPSPTSDPHYPTAPRVLVSP